MKKIIQISTILLFCTIGFAQQIRYKYDESTNQIFNVQTKLSYKMSYLYNPETGISHDFEKLESKIFIQIDDEGEGRFEVSQHNQIDKFTIESCYKKTYTDSSNLYLQFNCRAENGKEVYFYLHIENNEHQKIWFENIDDERVYYYN